MLRVGKADLAADEVLEAGGPVVRHMQANRARRLGLAAEAAVRAVLLLVGLDVIGRGVGVVGVPVCEQLRQRLLVARRVADLRDRSLVPVEAEPRERVEDLRDVLLGGALAVGIFDPQHE